MSNNFSDFKEWVFENYPAIREEGKKAISYEEFEKILRDRYNDDDFTNQFFSTLKSLYKKEKKGRQ